MNKFTKDMLMSKYGGRDGRNPYGSRGGYVSTRRPRRDRGMDDYGRSTGRYYDARHAEGGMYEGDRRERDSDYRAYDMRSPRNYDYRRMDYDHEMDYDYGDMYDYGDEHDMMDYGRRDYGEKEYGKMSHEDMKKWEKDLMNRDGTRGAHFSKEHIDQFSRSLGIDVSSLGGVDIVRMTANMMYSDYCDVAKKFGVDRPEFYVSMAKSFLDDKDFHGKPEEKLWLYYKCIAEKE